MKAEQKFSGTKNDSNIYVSLFFKVNEPDKARFTLENINYFEEFVQITKTFVRNLQIEEMDSNSIALYIRYSSTDGSPADESFENIKRDVEGIVNHAEVILEKKQLLTES